MRAKCGNCKFYLGMGDWNLCCSNPPKDEVSWAGFLCYADTAPCHNYIYRCAELKIEKGSDANEVKSSVS